MDVSGLFIHRIEALFITEWVANIQHNWTTGENILTCVAQRSQSCGIVKAWFSQIMVRLMTDRHLYEFGKSHATKTCDILQSRGPQDQLFLQKLLLQVKLKFLPKEICGRDIFWTLRWQIYCLEKEGHGNCYFSIWCGSWIGQKSRRIDITWRHYLTF